MAGEEGTAASAAPGSLGGCSVAPGVVWRDLGDRVLVLGERDGELFVLGGSGSLIWRVIVASSEGAGAGAASDLVAASDADAVAAYVDDLTCKGLVRRAS